MAKIFNQETLMQTLKNIIDQFDYDSADIPLDASLDNVVGMDSLDLAAMAVIVEEELEIIITDGNRDYFDTLQAFYNACEKKLKEQIL